MSVDYSVARQTREDCAGATESLRDRIIVTFSFAPRRDPVEDLAFRVAP